MKKKIAILGSTGSIGKTLINILLAKTMAELDRLLSTAENFQQKVSSFLPI